MVALLVALALSADPVRLGATGLTYVDLPREKGDLFADRLFKQLELRGLRLTGRAEVEALLGAERQKQLLGCAEESQSCLAELAGALGTDGLLTGTLGRAGSGYVVSLKVVDSSGRSLAVASARPGDEDALLDFLDAAADDLARQVLGALHREAVPMVGVTAGPQKTSAKSLWPLPTAVGVAVLVGGGVLWGLAKNVEQQLRLGMPMTNDAGLGATVQTGRTYELVGWVLGGVGLGLVATGVLLATLGGSEAKVAVVPVPGGAAAVFGGAWP